MVTWLLATGQSIVLQLLVTQPGIEFARVFLKLISARLSLSVRTLFRPLFGLYAVAELHRVAFCLRACVSMSMAMAVAPTQQNAGRPWFVNVLCACMHACLSVGWLAGWLVGWLVGCCVGPNWDGERSS